MKIVMGLLPPNSHQAWRPVAGADKVSPREKEKLGPPLKMVEEGNLMVKNMATINRLIEGAGVGGDCQQNGRNATY